MTGDVARRRLAPDTIVVVAELAVLRALEAAGKRARLPRACMATAKSVPPHTVHEQFALAANTGECDRLLAGVWDHLALVVPAHAGPLAAACDAYVRELIVHRRPHTAAALGVWLDEYRLAG